MTLDAIFGSGVSTAAVFDPFAAGRGAAVSVGPFSARESSGVTPAPPWPVLVVDDDQGVRDVTRLVLGRLEVDGRALVLTLCTSAAEARRRLAVESFAVAILDVSMESAQAGLELVREMRADPRHDLTQIVVRTGEPGAYPEARIIEDFHISDYWPKTELSAARMRTSVVGLVRSHETARRLHAGLRERDTLLREMHHRVKNNLQILSSLLSLQARGVDEGTRQALQQFAGRIRAMARVHQQLYGHDSLSAIDFASYLSGLAREVAEALGHEAVIRCQGDPVWLGVEVAIPAGLILNEVLTNAARHGRSADGVARVDVTLTTLPDRLLVAVRDRGPGLAETTGEGGLGGRLIAVLARQIRADLTRRVDAGMHVTLAIPLPPRG